MERPQFFLASCVFVVCVNHVVYDIIKCCGPPIETGSAVI